MDAAPALGARTKPSRLRALGLWAVVAAVVASLPTLSVDLLSDDLTHRLILEGNGPDPAGSPLALYDFMPPSFPAADLVAQGYLPWFTDAELSLRFFRPLSSATLALDHVLFGRNAALAHAHSLLWMAALALAAARLYARWFAAPAALASTLVFALSGAHAIPLGWVAARHTLVAAAFGAWALWAWLRAREDGRPGYLLVALGCLAAGLAASESGLVAVVLLAGHELGTRGLRRGLAGAALPLGAGLAYVVAYGAFGYGAHNSDFYISPFDAPLAYLGAAALGVPALAGELLLGVPSIAAGMGGLPALLVFGGLGAGACYGAARLARALWPELAPEARRTLRWLAPASLLALLGLVGAPVSGRVLPLPALGAAALAGNLLFAAWRRARGQGSVAAPPRKRWWAAVAVVALFQLGVSPLVRLSLPAQLDAGADGLERIAREADVGVCGSGGSLYLLNGSDPTLALYLAAALRFHTPEKAGAERLRVLSMAPQAQQLTRRDARTLELEVLGDERESHAFERLFRAERHGLRPGRTIALPELAVHVDAAEEGLFTRARFELEGPIDPLRTCLLVWRDGAVQSLPLPASGESVRIEHQPGPMGL